MKKIILFISVISSMLLYSCGKDKYIYDDNSGTIQKNEGIVEFSLSKSDVVVTKANPELNVSNFTVEIFNSAGVKIKKWDKFSEISGQKVRLNIGTYKVKAYYGDPNAAGFDVVYFAGESAFTVEGQKNKSIAVTCKQANVQMKVNWGALMASTYTNYTLKAVKSGSTDTLMFTKTETRSGYLPAGKILLKLELLSSDGKTRVYYPDPITCEANDFMTLTINAKSPSTYDVTFSFSIDAVTEDKVVNVTIPAILKGKDAPSISSDNFDSEGQITFIEGLGATAKININAPGYLKSCKLRVNSSYLNEKGWPTEIELTQVDATTSALLKQYGLSWLENMTDSKLSYIDFTGLTKLLPYETPTTVNSFTIKVTDAYNQTTERSCSLKPTAASVNISNILDYNVWAKKIIIEVSTANGNIDAVVLESNSGSGWQAQNVTEVSKTATSKILQIVVTPGTNYSFRAKYNNTYSDVVSCTTESELQVENSGFETWTNSTMTIAKKLGISYGNFIQDIYYPYSGGTQWWDMNSKATMPSTITPSNENFKAFPTVSYVTTGRSGKAAQIMSIAVNNGNTSGTSLGDATPGELFIGSYSGTTGHAFASRPAKLQFYYMYSVKDRDNSDGSDEFEAYIELRNGTTVIGSGKFTASAKESAPVSSWTLGEAAINYTNTTKKATIIYIRFKSSTDSSAPYNKNTTVTLPSGDKNCHGGSILLVDDLNLVY